MKPPRKSSLLHRVVVHLLYKHRKEKTIQTEDERFLTQAFPKRIIYLFDRYSVSKKSASAAFSAKTRFPCSQISAFCALAARSPCICSRLRVALRFAQQPTGMTLPSGACGAAGKTCRETLLRKASESTAHAAGFGIQLGGLRPSETPKRFFDNLGSVAILWRTFFACVR